MANTQDAIEDEYVIKTSHGRINGRKYTTVYGHDYFSFEKIPYAQPPLGELRFKSPLPMKPWNGILDCTIPGHKPVQLNKQTNEVEGDEDCLHLNIYVKKLKSDRPLPVMIYIHGGGYTQGDATRNKHSPDYFMMKDVLLATIGYRLGALGFLSMDDPNLEVPGNAGLKDQLMALRWLKANVANFNGDTKNITLFGESAGAGSTHFMMLAPQAKGLFHKAILLSGTVLCSLARQTLRDMPRRLAEHNGLPEDQKDEDILELLKSLPAAKLVETNLLTREENLADCFYNFGPVVEPYIGEDCILPKKPIELLSNAWSNELPVIISGTSFEGLLMYSNAKSLIADLQEQPDKLLPWELKPDLSADKQKQFAALIQETHFKNRSLAIFNILNYCDYISYKIFWHPIYRVLKARLHHAACAETYLCRFDFDSPDFNHQRIHYCGKKERGVAHADDLSYLFYGVFSWKLNKATDEYKTIERMIGTYTSFAANSNPNCPELFAALKLSNSTQTVKWEPLQTIRSLHCLNIGHEVTVIDLPEMEKIQVWESFYEEPPPKIKCV